MATKKQASEVLGISPKEVLRRVADGRLKGHRVGHPKFGDWDIDLDGVAPPTQQEVNREVNEAIKEIEQEKEVVPVEETAPVAEEPVEQVAVESITEEPAKIEKEETHDAERPRVVQSKENKTSGDRWWF